ncbi:hypothetical protein EDD85DRAFT_114081 [Armillaria nabsnona]|nr:hypothetical protein EDD85DRAFT_114081 [Armillaria nabsnona]
MGNTPSKKTLYQFLHSGVKSIWSRLQPIFSSSTKSVSEGSSVAPDDDFDMFHGFNTVEYEGIRQLANERWIQHVTLPKVTISASTEVGVAESAIAVPKQRIYTGHVEFCVCVCVHAFAFSRMRLSRLRERDMDAFVGRLVHLGLQTPVKLFY